MRLLPTRRRVAVALALVAAAGVVAGPSLLWHAEPPLALRTLLVDETVTTPEAREHAGAVWVLDHARVRDAAGNVPRVGAYSGVHPDPEHLDRLGTVTQVPDAPGTVDLLYVTDTYGVYRADLPGAAPATEADRGARPLHGGTSAADAARMRAAVAPRGTWLAEFNSFAEPTPRDGRAAMQDAFGVTWTGWTGRHFPALAAGGELPAWVVPTWRRAHAQAPWPFTGAGYVLVHEDGRLLVLPDLHAQRPDGPGLVLRTGPAQRERLGAPASIPYDYWFDVVATRPGTQVLASYGWRLGRAQRDELAAAGLPQSFPAVTQRDTPALRTVYLAGDFADQAAVALPGWRRAGTPRWRRWQTQLQRDDQTAFFWRFSQPVLDALVHEQARRTAAG